MFENEITALFDSYRKSREISEKWNARMREKVDMPLFMRRMRQRSREINRCCGENSALFKSVQQPILSGEMKLDDSDYSCLYNCLYDMYINDYDDPFTLSSLGELLISYYEKTDDIDRQMFSYIVTAYGYQERSRTIDSEAGRRSVTYFLRAVRMRKKFDRFKNPKSREFVFVAYTNLIRVSCTLDNLTMSRVYILWKQCTDFYNSELCAKYLAAQPRITRLFLYLDDDFRTYSAEQYLDEKKVHSWGRKSRRFSQSLYHELRSISYEHFKKYAQEHGDLSGNPVMICNCEAMLAFDGLQTFSEAWTHLDEFYQKNRKRIICGNDESEEPIGDVINPLRRVILMLDSCENIDDDKKSEICVRYGEDMLEFARRRDSSQDSYAVNGSLEGLCFDKSFLTMLDFKSKEWIFFNLIISRHIVTYVHSVMVGREVKILLPYLFEQCPELLIGVENTKTAADVLRRRAEIEKFSVMAALFHDIGKNSIIDVINTDERKISDTEFGLINQHPERGKKYLMRDPAYSRFADVAMGHHKFYNGQGGYPAKFDNTSSKLRGLIDIVTVCDCMDAATDYMGRNYHRAKKVDSVIDEIVSGAGTRYNPVLAKLISENKDIRKKLRKLLEHDRSEVYYNAYKESFADKGNFN